MQQNSAGVGPSAIAAGGKAAVRMLPNGHGQVKVTGDLTFETVGTLLEASRQLFREVDGDVQFDLRGVNRADSGGLSLLVEWMRMAAARRHRIKFVNLPEQMRSIARTCGLHKVLPMGEAADAAAVD